MLKAGWVTTYEQVIVPLELPSALLCNSNLIRPVLSMASGAKRNLFVSRTKQSEPKVPLLLPRSSSPIEFRAARRGMWVNGTDAESPAEYKRRHALAESSDTKVVDKRVKADSNNTDSNEKKGWFGRLFSR